MTTMTMIQVRQSAPTELGIYTKTNNELVSEIKLASYKLHNQSLVKQNTFLKHFYKWTRVDAHAVLQS